MSGEAYFGRFDNAATETVDDILAKMRIFKCRNLSTGVLEECTAISKYLADRIEAAHKRELETKDSVIQTLSAARDDELDRHRREVDALKRRRSELDAEVAAKDEVIMRLDAEIRKYQEERELRIATPARNCDVGTAEEQSKRLHDYCKSHRCLNCSSGNGDECKFYRPGMKTDCKIEWANASYESEAAK